MKDTDMDKDDTKAEFSEYLENGLTPQAVDFQKKEARLVKKLDLFIAPVMMMLMLISYLDRKFPIALDGIDTD